MCVRWHGLVAGKLFSCRNLLVKNNWAGSHLLRCGNQKRHDCFGLFYSAEHCFGFSIQALGKPCCRVFLEFLDLLPCGANAAMIRSCLFFCSEPKLRAEYGVRKGRPCYVWKKIKPFGCSQSVLGIWPRLARARIDLPYDGLVSIWVLVLYISGQGSNRRRLWPMWMK